MKNLLQIALICLFAIGYAAQADAQLQTPAASPNAKVTFNVGLSEVHIDYNRPSVRDRVIFGGLVPYGEPWRTGANSSTKITFSDDVMIMGNELAAGTYSLFSVPSEDSWEIIFHSNLTHNSPGPRDVEEDVLVVTVPANTMDAFVETFTITLNNLRNSSADIHISWENTYVNIPFTVDTEAKVMANIERVMAGPSGRDYFVAAAYYFEEGKDLNQALKWMKKSIEKDGERFWVLRTKGLIQAELGHHSDAIKTLEKSSKLAREWGNEGYARMNDESIAEIRSRR